MLFDEHSPLTLTQYLGCLHAFVLQFQDTLSTVRKFATQMSGQSRSVAFGWASSLDQARYNVSLIVDRWHYFNESAQDRLQMTPEESDLYGAIPSIHHALEICGELEDMLERISQFIDALIVGDVTHRDDLLDQFNEISKVGFRKARTLFIYLAKFLSQTAQHYRQPVA